MVGVSGFEPPAPASRRQYSTRLSYTPTTVSRCIVLREVIFVNRCSLKVVRRDLEISNRNKSRVQLPVFGRGLEN